MSIENSMSKGSLTLKHAVHQFTFWAGTGGVVSFAVAYLTQRGFTAAQAGWILFGAYAASFLLQPVLGTAADKSRRNLLPVLTVILSAVSILCFLLVRFAGMPPPLFSFVYLAGVLCLDAQTPLLNAINVYYTQRGWKLNFGLARGMGGLGFGVATLGCGFLMDHLGAETMPAAASAVLLISAITAATYPEDNSSPLSTERAEAKDTSTLPQFVRRYKWYCASLAGVLMFALFHAMTENYLIEIFSKLGGSSSNVGICLFICTATELPAMAVYPPVLKKTGVKKQLFAAAVFFTLKALLYLSAGTVTAVYLIQLLQCVTYVPLTMSMLYYAQGCTSAGDMIKGQAVITAAFTLGCAAGNLAGGVIISAAGIGAMLLAGFGAVSAGLVIFLLTVPKALKKAGDML